jgi:hypothetical protein
MTFKLFAALSWAILSSATYIEREPQQSQPSAPFNLSKVMHAVEQVAPNIRAIATTAEPQLRSDAKRKILRFGPHMIPASNVPSLYLNLNAYD